MKYPKPEDNYSCEVLCDNFMEMEMHSKNTDTHCTLEEKETWNNKSDFSGKYADLSGKPTKVSAFSNDAGYLTEHQSLSDYYKKSETYSQTEVDSKVSDLSQEIDDLETEKVAKTGLTLAKHTDGLIYIFVDGVATGNGVEMGETGDIIGVVDSNNNIVLTGELPDGTYTIVYEDADGEQTVIGGFTLGQVLELFVPSTCTLNSRLSSSGAVSSQNSTFVTDYIDIGDLEPSGARTILFSGFQIQMGRTSSPYTGIEVFDANKTRLGKDDTEYNDTIEYDESGLKTFKATVNNPSTSTTARYIRVYGHLGEEYATQGTPALTSTDQLANCSLVLA